MPILERMTGFEPVPQGLEGPWATVTPHSLWFGLRVTIPSLHAGNVECSPHTQAEHGPVSFTGPSRFVSCQRTHSYELVGSKGFESNSSQWENGVTARQRTIRSYRPLATAPQRARSDRSEKERTNSLRALRKQRTWTHELWRLGCFQLHHAADVASRLDGFEDKTSPRPDGRLLPCVRPKQKRPSRGSP